MSSSYENHGIFVGEETTLINVIDFLMEETAISEIMHTDEHNARAMQEQTSALKSLQTNLVVFLVGMTAAIITYQFPDNYQEQLSLANASLQKLLFPTLTTVANFGTIRSVSKVFLAKLFLTDQVKPSVLH